jgi:3-phosphoshikimate 1-carboxyvinyltransferase
MRYIVTPSSISGTVAIPGSKSHTIRALVIGALSTGTSEIHVPLDSSDTRSCVEMIEGFGAAVEILPDLWKVTGIGDTLSAPDNVIDVGNSGTTLYIGMGMASLIKGYTVFTGDHQIRNRPADALIKCINDLGGEAFSITSQ